MTLFNTLFLAQLHTLFAAVQAFNWEHWTTQNFIYIEGPSLGGWVMIPNRHRTNAEESNEASLAALELELIEVHHVAISRISNAAWLVDSSWLLKALQPPTATVRSCPAVDVKVQRARRKSC